MIRVWHILGYLGNTGYNDRKYSLGGLEMRTSACRKEAYRNFNRATEALLLALAWAGVSPASAQTVPPDPSPTCTVPAATFATWFQSGSVALNGVVNPANSVAFINLPNCPFYQWAEQMFLWVTSPAPSFYGGGDHIFNSPTFFDVSPR
jgi:hypothetical protein